MSNQIAIMADRLNVKEDELQSIVKATIMPAKVQVSNEQFVSFMAVANEYNLNPLVKEIYAFPAKGGGIQPVVSIDGWIKIANNHPDFDGMTFVDEMDDKGYPISITCEIHRKSMSRPITTTEYMSECDRGTEPWKKWPRRMLKHKSTIQAIRYAFGISGIIDPDEAERFKEVKAITRDITPKTNIIEQAATEPQEYTKQEIYDKFSDLIEQANNPGELQAFFGEGWKLLKAMAAGNESKSLQELYEEKKAYFVELEKDSE